MTTPLNRTDNEPDFSVYVGDDKVPWDVTITDAFGNYVDLTGASIAVKARIRNQSVAEASFAGSVIGTTPQTQARRLIANGDFAEGHYDAVFVATLAGGEVVTWPPNRQLFLQVIARP
jgi:hypothetical protein